jgi:hypothetical protein
MCRWGKSYDTRKYFEQSDGREREIREGSTQGEERRRERRGKEEIGGGMERGRRE